MGHECFSFHQLRLLNFNKFSNHFCRLSGEIKKYHDHEENNSGAKKQSKLIINCSVGNNTKSLKSTSKVILQKRLRSPLSTNFVSKRLSFGKTTSKSPINTKTFQKSRRLRDVEQKFSLYGVFSDKIKPKICSLLKSKTGLKRKKRTTKQDSPRHHKGDDIQVLFDANRFKSEKRLKKRNCTGDCRFDVLYDSKSSRNANDFKFAQRHKCNNIRHKRDFTHTQTDIQNNNASLSSSTCPCSKPVHYRLVDFPCPKANKCLDVKMCSCRNCNYNLSTEKRRPRRSREVLVTPSCLCIRKNDAGDSAMCRQCLDSKIEADCLEKHTGDGDTELLKCKYTKCPGKPTFSLFSVCFCNNHCVTVIKSVIKKIILGFVIIAWSPCIISVYTYWLITYPLRPQHIFTQAKFDESGKNKSCGNLLWHCIFHSIARFLEKIVQAYNILISSIKNNKSCVHDTNNIKPCLPQLYLVNRYLRHKHRKLHINPNPKERYTLCYMRRRGWVVKASRKYRNRKHNLHKCYPKDINITKICDAMKHKKYPGVFQIQTCGTLPSFKKSPCIRISKKRPKENKPERNIRTYLSKMVSTKSSPGLIISSSIIVKPLSKCTMTKKYNTSTIFKRKVKSCPCNFRDNPLHTSIENIETNTRKRSIPKCRHSRNFLSNSQIYLPFDKYLCRQKHQEPFRKNHKCTGCSRRKTGWTPCSYTHRKIKSHSKRSPCCPKITVLKPSKRRTRTKYVLSSRDNLRKLKYIMGVNQSKKLTMREKLIRFYKNVLTNIKCVASATDNEVWESEDICKDMYATSLRKKPWFWIYKLCPSFYPYFLVFIRFNENCVHCFLLMISSCIWLPIMCCCYFCCSLIFDCL